MNPIPLDDAKPINKGIIFLVLLGLFLSGCMIWYLYIPIEKGSFIFWIGLILIILPVWIAFEGLGEAIFLEKLGKKMARGMRILYGVVVMIIILFILSLGESFFIAFFGIH